jgi:methyltransferase (TIGR00027 family)
VKQYVILGAGFDTFAFRRPDLEQVQVFELDHPTTQAMKKERIATAGWGLPPNLHFVPIDFSKDSLGDALQQSGFDARQASFFSWLGVTYYLTRETIFATLQSIVASCAGGSRLVFDYMDKDAFVPESAAQRMQLMQWIARQVGEPMKTGFDPTALAGELAGVGLRLEENLDPAQIQLRYFAGRSDRYRAYEHVHFARAIKD